jgi:hypothetical protein
MSLENCRDNINLSFLYVTTPVAVMKLGRRAVGDRLGPVKEERVFTMTSLYELQYPLRKVY